MCRTCIYCEKFRHGVSSCIFPDNVQAGKYIGKEGMFITTEKWAMKNCKGYKAEKKGRK